MAEFNSRQVRNGKAIIARVKKRGKLQGWTRDHTQFIARLCIECALTESNLQVYASHKVPGSLALPHDAVGSDHLSVGLFQQQVPMWGNVHDCQTADPSTRKFLNALRDKGLDGEQGPQAHHRIQSVQVSYDPTGRNYLVNANRAIRFRRRYFLTTRAAKG